MGAVTTLSARYKVVTPLMVGGANHAPGFRVASYANMVRWWWRFLALGRYGDAAIASFWEAVMFGWHAKPFGQKRATFSLKSQVVGPPDGWSSVPDDWKAWSGVQYLTAQGFKDGRFPTVIKRFEVEIGLAEPETGPFVWFLAEQNEGDGKRFLAARLEAWATESTTTRDALIDAVALIGLIGGLGARSRRGFGALAIEALDGDPRVDPARVQMGIPQDVASYKAMIAACLGTARFAGEPPYTALSDRTRINICATRSGNSIDLMNEIGWAFQIYRSWGQRTDRDDPTKGHRHEFRTPGVRPRTLHAGTAKAGWYRPEFAADHNDFYAKGFPSENGQGKPVVDNRSVFGLPHNYGKTQIGWTDGGSDPGRRASPLMMHFHPLAEGSHAAVVMTVPSLFVPPNSQLEVRPANPKNQRPFPTATNWGLIEGFVDFVVTPPSGANRAPGRGVIHAEYTPVPASTGAVP